MLRRRVCQAAALPSGFQAPLRVRPSEPYRERRVAQPVHLLAEHQRVEFPREQFLPVAGPAADPRGELAAASAFAEPLRAVAACEAPLLEVLRVAAAQQAVSSFAAVRVPIPFRAPAVAQRPAAALAVQEVSPNAGPRVAAAQPDAGAAAAVAQPDAEVAAEVVRPDVVAVEAVQPGAVAAEAARPDGVEAPEAV